MNRGTSDKLLHGIACGTLFAALCAPAAWAYMSSEPGQPSQEVTTIQELEKNNQKEVARDVQKAWKENGGKTAQQMEQEFVEQQAREAERKAAEAAKQAEQAPPRKLAIEGFDPQGNRKPPKEELIGDAKEKPAPQQGKSVFGQLQQSAGGKASGDVPTVDGGGAVAGAPPVTGTPEKEEKDDPAKIRENITQICEKTAQDERAKALCNKYYNDVYFQARSYGGWIGKTQKAMREDIKNRNIGNFPKIKFGEVPAGAAATWSGSPDGSGEAVVTMGAFLPTSGKSTEKIADHEIGCHHADAKHWDGTQLGDNPKHDVEPPCYGSMGSRNQGESDETF